MLIGDYRNMLDDKGRMLIPSKLRTSLGVESVVVTRGIESCLWIFPPAFFEKLRGAIMDDPGAMFDKQLRLIQRMIIAPAQEIEIDKTGRINIPPTLRTYAQLQPKEEGLILGISSYLELWNPTTYDQYMLENEAEFESASQSLSALLRSAAGGK